MNIEVAEMRLLEIARRTAADNGWFLRVRESAPCTLRFTLQRDRRLEMFAMAAFVVSALSSVVVRDGPGFISIRWALHMALAGIFFWATNLRAEVARDECHRRIDVALHQHGFVVYNGPVGRIVECPG